MQGAGGRDMGISKRRRLETRPSVIGVRSITRYPIPCNPLRCLKEPAGKSRVKKETYRSPRLYAAVHKIHKSPKPRSTEPLSPGPIGPGLKRIIEALCTHT